MIKKSYLIALLVSIVVILSSVTSIVSKKVEELPKINQEYLQNKIDIFLENNKTGKKSIVEYTINETKVRINNEASIEFDIKLESKNYIADIKATVTGIPEYKKEDMSFYLKPTEKIDFEKLDIESKKETGKLLGKISLANNLDPENKILKVIAEEIIYLYIKNFPIYKISDDNLKLKALGIALDEVKITNGEIKIKISFWEISKYIISIILIIFFTIITLITVIFKPKYFDSILIETHKNNQQ